MIRLIDNFDLSKYNTFGLKAHAKHFFEFTESEELAFYLQSNQLPIKTLILGGGSNLLFKGDFDGLVIHPNIPGVVEELEDRSFTYLEAGAGVEWDELVQLSVHYGLGGLENLSLIPGKVGAAPVQNIGAYGVEAKDSIHLVRAIDISNGSKLEFNNEQCCFAYRDSIFKNNMKGKVVITSVVFKLVKFPEFRLEYGTLKQEVERLGEVNLQNIRQAVINIRVSKLPDPKKLGNAGSFFKNPVIDAHEAKQIIDSYEHVPHYQTPVEGKIKLAAGWLIEQCGWKGYKNGNVGVHADQALVLVNYGGASGADLVALSKDIQQSVFDKFGVKLEPEINIIGE